MTASAALTTDLKRLVLTLEDDLRTRVEQDDARRTAWSDEHTAALRAGRTAASWVAWRDDRLTQVAVSWVLTTVFLRFCEDNALVTPVWITGPGPRRQEALDAQLAYFRTEPEHTDREWIEQGIAHLASLRATRALVDEHAPFRLASISGDAAGELLAFWRRRDDSGALVHDLTDDALDTRFLGDLYQDLSEHAKSTFALLQTPEFVEEFILDRTLEPALADRPLEGFRMIDPTCGSGHFLLGAFRRLRDRWDRHAPGLETQARVQAALDAVHGVDLNPFAVAIARFRLMVEALQACGLRSLEQAPAFRMHLAVGDSLLHGGQRTLDDDTDLSGFTYSYEDLTELQTILTAGRYDAVVGNPPYITVKDKVLNVEYRRRYPTCKGTYALTVPFMERFFGLAKLGTDDARPGWVGQITSNSFMKREFGSKIIEDFLVRKDLRLIVDTSGAYIPGHSTPTVIIVGRDQRPTGDEVRAVLGVRGEPGRPVVAERGLVWRSIVEHVDEPGWCDEWLSTTDRPRSVFATHPWSLSGGGAGSLLEALEASGAEALKSRVRRIGFMAMSHADQSFTYPSHFVSRANLAPTSFSPLMSGDEVRDFCVASKDRCWFPYDEGLLRKAPPTGQELRVLWPLVVELRERATFTGTYRSEGRAWYSWHQVPRDVGTSRSAIAFAFVATHNHFVLDRGGKVFKQSAPVIRLPEGASEDDHLALLGVLNSSTACFWLKQNSHCKGNATASSGIPDQPWSWNWEFTGTTLQDFPLPAALPLERGRHLDALAQRLAATTPAAVSERDVPTAEGLGAARTDYSAVRGRMIAVQEELDWEVYRLYGLVDEDLTYSGDDLPELSLGERAFEVALACAVAAGQESTAWFTRHGSTPVTELPGHWPTAYRQLVQRRLDLIATESSLRLLETPGHKRRWMSKAWEKQQTAALRDWLLDRLEDRALWFDRQGRPAPQSVAQLADRVERDADLISVLALWEGRPDVPVTKSLTTLLADEAVPYLAAHRYKDSGLRKRAAWEETWALQRREDAGEQLSEPIPVPPKYSTPDFRKVSYWQARGKLDVPKERFILYPGAGRDTDPTSLLGWAGWDHAQQSLALSIIIGAREEEGWSDERLVPLVAGLAELQPWVEQWHADVDPALGLSLASYCASQLADRMTQVGVTLDDLARWRPPASTRGRKPRAAVGS